MGQGSQHPIMTPALCRAARGLLDWTQEELAEHSTVSRSTIRDYEGARHDVHRATAAQIVRAFNDHGVVFPMVSDVGPAVCLVDGDAASKDPG
ncbi:helix-turn-helix transcriptional regulator [Ciceribacter sp. T2.26MG-112.2]|uniref:helix-turn-helix transcriptional regulator n=1 Tax=Ciceribacter sp. T2.26MG-112.2 TaxID=3137154 RepID=UPI0011DF09C7|nr:helix-turn-helix transcriptional regulator [Ciceribacter naphthalenivorans]